MKSNITLIALVAGLILSGCGKSNKTGGEAAPANNNPGVVTPITTTPITNTTWDSFKAQVAAGQFAAQYAATETYIYSSTSTKSSECLWVFTCTSTSTSYKKRYAYSSGLIRNEFCGGNGTCTKEKLVEELMKIINNVPSDPMYLHTWVRQNSATSFAVGASSSLYYVIDLSKPIGAQPVAVGSSKSYFLNAIYSGIYY
jgi:hypothetical protein